MGMIINIDEALKLRTDYNVLREPLNDMMKNQQEAWEKENPIDLIFHRGSISTFQETYTSSIGFDHAFAETSDYAVGPIFNTAEGFAATYRTRTFQGGFIITQQTLEDRQLGKAKDDATAFVKRWHGDIVEYSMKALEGGFADTTYNGSKLQLYSADTTDGFVDSQTKNRLFGKHNIVRREGAAAESTPQHNIYIPSADIELTDSDVVPKVAELINGVITEMENYLDDNGKIAGVNGAKSIVAANDPRLKAILKSAVEMDMFKAGANSILNLAYGRATVATTPYLNEIVKDFIDSSSNEVPMFFIVDKSYNAENHGLELTERVAFTLDVFDHKEAPKGVKYEGRQRFDINVATWRGIAAVFLRGTKDITCNGSTILDVSESEKGATTITVSGISTPVTVVGEVTTKSAS